MPESLTIRTDEETLDRLEKLARATKRSRNFHDYRSRTWAEDDLDDLLAFLAAQRRLGREGGRLVELGWSAC